MLHTWDSVPRAGSVVILLILCVGGRTFQVRTLHFRVVPTAVWTCLRTPYLAQPLPFISSAGTLYWHHTKPFLREVYVSAAVTCSGNLCMEQWSLWAFWVSNWSWDHTTQVLPEWELISLRLCWCCMFEWQTGFCSSMDGNRCDWQRAPGISWKNKALFTWSVLLPCKVWKWVNTDNVFGFTSNIICPCCPFYQELSDYFISLFLRLPTT